MKFTRTITVTQVVRKIAVKAGRCPHCGRELAELPERDLSEIERAQKQRKLPAPERGSRKEK